MQDICLTINLLQVDGENKGVIAKEDIHAHLLIDGINNVEFKIFFEVGSRIDYYFSLNLDKIKPDYFISKIIEIKSINDKRKMLEIDISKSKLSSLKTSSNYYENGKEFFLVSIDSIRIVYEPIESEKDEKNTVEFYLNNVAKQIIEDLYYVKEFGWDKPNIWEAINYQTEYLKLGEIEFILDYHFYTKLNEEDNYVIYKEPRIVIKHTNMSENKILDYATLICSILSLYSGNAINYNFARIHNLTNTVTITKIAKEEIVKSISKLREIDFGIDLLDIFNQLEISILNQVNFISEVIYRYNYTKLLLGETKFMLLYNLVEQIRVFYVKKANQVQEAFKFKVSNKKANDYIKEKLLDVAFIVEDSEKVEFEKHVVNHIKTIKYKPLVNQIDSLFEYLKIELSGYEVDFKKMKQMRDRVFHGANIEEEEIVKKSNIVLNRIVGVLILNLIGITKFNDA